MFGSLIGRLSAVALLLPASPRRPAADYETAVARIAVRQAQDDSVVVAGARTVFMGHGHRTPRVFVLLHGFTDAPRQFEALGGRFFAGGDNVYIPRLPHHAEREGRVRALGKITPGELAAFGDSSVDIALGLGDSIIVVGLSAGGNVAASVAQHRAEVYRAVLIAPAIAAGRIPEDDARGVAAVAARLPNIVRSERPDSARPDFVQGISTRGLAQVLLLGESVHAEAEKTPGSARQIAFLLNQNDRTVNDDAAIDLARRWTVGAPLVSVYQFPADLRLPHNVLETTARGGNTELVLPVVEAIALGRPTPDAVRYQFIVSDWSRPRTPGHPAVKIRLSFLRQGPLTALRGVTSTDVSILRGMMRIAHRRASFIAATSAMIGLAACSGGGSKSQPMDAALKQDLEMAPKAGQQQVVISADEAGPQSAPKAAAPRIIPRPTPKPAPRLASNRDMTPAPAPRPTETVQTPSAPAQQAEPAPLPKEPPPLPPDNRVNQERQKGVYKTEGQVFQQMPWIKP